MKGKRRQYLLIMKCSILSSEYYPPVYVIAKFLDYLRPSMLGLSSPAEFENHVTVDADVEKSVTESEKSEKITTPKNKRFFKRINPFSQANEEAKGQTKAENPPAVATKKSSFEESKGRTKTENPPAAATKKSSSEESKGRTNLAKLTTYARRASDKTRR